MRKIYLDNNATTGVDPRVVEAMLEDLCAIPANPSSVHSFGKEAKKKLMRARVSISGFFHVRPEEILFTSGGTEAMAMLLRGFCAKHPRCHILSSNVEHSSTTALLRDLESQGAKLTLLPAGLWGAIQPEQLEAALKEKIDLIVLMSASNITGVKTDLEAVAKVAEKHKIPLILDGVSHLGKELFSIPKGVSAMTFSGHKFHAPKGIGMAIVRHNLKIAPLFVGGGQEGNRRAGTENLAGILGLAKAIELLPQELPAATPRMEKLRNRLTDGLMDKIGNIVVHGQGPRICNTVHIGFPGVDGETLLIELDRNGIAASHGSACSSGGLEPSAVLLNMAIPMSLARTSIRFSLSRWTTTEEIEEAIDIISRLVLTQK
ncbi:MAG: cysteine desulfurase [Verrucomicrobia bacterium]|nr:cysteine desulfurase [Verrucomicrobiota bacterium]